MPWCNTKVLKMNAGSSYIPKDNIQRPKGEDAHFICPEKNTIGVADGVGGWAARGVDSGKYSRGLMNNSLIALEKEIAGYVNPSKVLDTAFENTILKGSYTACIIALNGKFLDYVNVGDSGLMVFRDKKLMCRSPVQQHRFNVPYQLGCSSSSDKPSSAYDEIMIVKEGDIVVAGTDGLLDNMYPSEVLEILEQECDKEPEEIASVIAECALFNALDEEYFSPFAQAAEKAGIYDKLGGKYDDITVIVAKIE
ncbi:Protein phosphatase 2C family protein [Euphorbia peplus]|nr:Protein phosphatase 2C family protein [Euphorbia peplus]